MSTHITTALRIEVINRSGNCCEYCLLSQEDIFFSFEIDHIIAEKHEGATVSENLCLSCPDCNRYKGSDIASIDRETKALTALYNPRTQAWDDHFQLQGAIIYAQTPVGRVTERLLRLNESERIRDREIYSDSGNYPCRPDTISNGGAT